MRARLALYLVALHVALAVLAIAAIPSRAWVFAVEAALVVSAAAGVGLLRAVAAPLDMVRTGADLIREGDFGSRFTESGQPDVDALVHVYNGMIERLREERLRLEEQNVFVHKVIEASPSGLVVLDHDGRVAAANASAARALGLARDRVLGERIPALPGPLARALDALATGASEVVSADGQRRVRLSRHEFFDRGFTRAFFVIEELTEELRASEQAAYRQLVRMMSHEVGNTVAAVASLLDSCSSFAASLPPGDAEDVANALAVSIARLGSLDAFMRGFAEVVRLPAPDPRPCDLARLVDDILVLLRPELDRRRIETRWTRRDAPSEVAADKNQLEQVLVNVLRNAAEAIGEDGGIEIALARADGRVVLTIADTGPGIPDAIAAELFTPFFSTKRNGRGLGLTLTREVLAAHGAEFGLGNRGDGHGAEFRVRFGPVSPHVRS